MWGVSSRASALLWRCCGQEVQLGQAACAAVLDSKGVSLTVRAALTGRLTRQSPVPPTSAAPPAAAAVAGTAR